MGASSKSKSKSKSSRSSRWGAWSDWAWEEDRQFWYRVRQDADGKLDYGYSSEQQQPGSDSRSRESATSERWGAWSDWSWDMERNTYYRVRQDAQGEQDYQTRKHAPGNSQDETFPLDQGGRGTPRAFQGESSRQAAGPGLARDRDDLGSYSDYTSNSGNSYATGPYALDPYATDPYGKGNTAGLSSSYGSSHESGYDSHSNGGAYTYSSSSAEPHAEQTEEEWERKRERDNTRRQRNQNRFRHPERATSKPEDLDPEGVALDPENQ